MCEVISGVDIPLVTGTVVMVLLDHASGQIPHLGTAFVGICQTLLHAKVSLPSLIFTIPHGSEFC